MKGLRGWVSENRRQVIAGTVMVLCIAAMLALPHDVVRQGMRILVAAFVAAAYVLHRRWWAPVVAFLLIMLVGVYALLGYIVGHDMVSGEPFRQSQELDVPVVPGGEFVCLHYEAKKGFGVTVCFYMPGDGPCVVAAHQCGRTPGDTLSLCPASEALVIEPEQAGDGGSGESSGTASTGTAPGESGGTGTVGAGTAGGGSGTPGGPGPSAEPGASGFLGITKVLTDCEYGVVMEGLKCPEPDREELPLARAGDVKVGEEAVIRTSKQGDVSVRVMGFSRSPQYHFLVLQLLDKKSRIGAGNSGSPVIQDGKVIAFVYAIFGIPYRGPKLVLTRPAMEVYEALQDYLEPSI